MGLLLELLGIDLDGVGSAFGWEPDSFWYTSIWLSGVSIAEFEKHPIWRDHQVTC